MKAIKSISAAVIVVGMTAVMCLPSGRAEAGDQVISDSLLTVIKLKALDARKTELVKRIETEDAKRGRTMAGVTAETAERINTSQDSICLELRSQLVGLELEISELSQDK